MSDDVEVPQPTVRLDEKGSITLKVALTSVALGSAIMKTLIGDKVMGVSDEDSSKYISDSLMANLNI